MKPYHYLVVGSGISGAVFAHEATRNGRKCLVVEKRGHIGGNIFDLEVDGILLHRYGAHIFHTFSQRIWNYLQQFTEFNHYRNAPVANFHGEIYNLPFNMNTFYKLWGVTTPEQARQILEQQRVSYGHTPHNVEEQALSQAGKDIYEKLIRGYTEKQWGRNCNELPASILKRIPFRFTYDNNYFDDPYQGIPVGGYTKMIEKMLLGSQVRMNTDYLKNRAYLNSLADRVFYTGMLDAYFEFSEGHLQYRSLHFEDMHYQNPNIQGVGVMNYTDKETPYTRTIEHKHFLFGKQPNTIVTREYPVEWSPGMEPYYPISDEKNVSLFNKYWNMAKQERNTIFCGRLAQYRYYNMDQAVTASLAASMYEFDRDKYTEED